MVDGTKNHLLLISLVRDLFDIQFGESVDFPCKVYFVARKML